MLVVQVAMACAYESVKHVIKEDLAGRAAALEVVMVEEMQQIVERLLDACWQCAVCHGMNIQMCGTACECLA